MKLISNKLEDNKSSLEKLNFDEKKEIIRDNKKKKVIYKSLKDIKREIL